MCSSDLFPSHDTALFVKDTIKTGILFLVFGSLVVAGISFIINSFQSWWIWGFAFIFAVIILINMLYPVIRDKMFDKFEKLKDKELEAKIENLLDKVGFKSSGVFSVDASKRDNRLNAYFGGLGSTKRVVLFDTLVEKLTHNELLAVLGHELGHFKNGDILKNIGIMGLVMFIYTNEEMKESKEATVQILKNRNGRTIDEPLSVYADGETYVFGDEMEGFTSVISTSEMDDIFSVGMDISNLL